MFGSRVYKPWLVLMVALVLAVVPRSTQAATNGFCVNDIFFPHLKLPKPGKCKLVTGSYGVGVTAQGFASGRVCTEPRDRVSVFDLTLVQIVQEDPQSSTAASEQIFVKKDTLTALVMYELALDGSRANFETSALYCQQ